MSRSICARRSKFLSTPSARRATLYNHRHAHCCQISIHALREEGDVAGRRGQLLHRISIHALREEGDRRRERRTTRSRDFYPRPPRGGRPAGGPGSFHGRQISIHALREEGDVLAGPLPAGKVISIHALREEGDLADKGLISMYREFLSTPSARRATRPQRSPTTRRAISIHALREEGDLQQVVGQPLRNVISIHALREEGDSQGCVQSR